MLSFYYLNQRREERDVLCNPHSKLPPGAACFFDKEDLYCDQFLDPNYLRECFIYSQTPDNGGGKQLRIPGKYGYENVDQYRYTISALNAYLANDMDFYKEYLNLSTLTEDSEIAFDANNEPINPFAMIPSQEEPIIKSILKFINEKNAPKKIKRADTPEIKRKPSF